MLVSYMWLQHAHATILQYIKTKYNPNMENINLEEVIEVVIAPKEYKEWTIGGTKLLIELYKTKRKKVGTGEIKKMKNLWHQIAAEMQKNGYEYSNANCENRWKVLERNFKKHIDNQKQTGAGRKMFEYFEEMREIYDTKKSIFPQVLLTADEEIRFPTALNDSSATISAVVNEGSTEAIQPSVVQSMQSVIKTPDQSTRRRKRTQQLNRRDVLQDLNNNFKEYHKEKIDYYRKRARYYEERQKNESEILSELKNLNTTLRLIGNSFTESV